MANGKRVLVLSHTTGYQLRAFNEAAERLGVQLVFATDRCHRLDDPWQDHAIAVRFHELDASVKAIVAGTRARPVDGVIAVGDRPVVLAARAAEALGIPWHSVAGALASTDKRRSRRAIADAGLPAPRFEVRGSRAEGRTSLEFPVVLKPLGLSGSRGVIRANNLSEFEAAAARIAALLARPQIRAQRSGLEDEILVEEYVDGPEFALEGVLTRGALTAFALFDKPDPLTGPFFEETIYVTPSRLDPALQASIAGQVEAATRALGLSHGPLHAEVRIAGDGRIYVLEIAARPIGGLCARVLTFTGDASLEEVLLRHACGEDVRAYERETRGAAVMMIPIPGRGHLRRVDGEEAARGIAGVTDVRITAKADQLLEPLPEAGSYLGFLFARRETAADAERAVREAHRCLHFAIEKEIPVLKPGA